MKAYFKIIVAVIVIALIFIVRLAYLQLFTDRYALNAANTSIKTEYIIPQRGMIFDRTGKILVGNQPSYEVSVTTALIQPDFDTLSFCKLVGITKNHFVNRMREVKEERYYSSIAPMTFLKDLTRGDIARIQERIFVYPAFNIVSRPQRHYEVTTSGNLLGYTNEASSAYIKTDSTYYKPGDIVGITGVERSYEKTLRGIKGVKYIQKDIHMRDIGPYKEGKLDRPVVPGKDITLTIDYSIQKVAEEMLVGKHGAIVAIQPKTGEILALATGPDINPQLFMGTHRQRNIYKLQMDTIYNNRPTFNRAIQAAYPPGSTFKMYTALAAMQMGVMNSKTIFPCSRGFYYKGLHIAGHGGAEPLIPSLAISSNCFFTYAYLAIIDKYPNNPSKGVDEWSKIMHSFGFGEYLNNDLPVGSPGKIPNGKFYENRQKYLNKRDSRTKGNYKDWSPLSTGAVFNGMGQGDILLTPLQIANGGVAIANKGWFYTPHIVKKVDGKPNPDPRFKVKRRTLVEPAYFDTIQTAMRAVVQRGTARGIKTDLFTQMGKTGTAEVPHGEDNSVFILIAPADDPQIVVAAVIENAGFGSTWAAPASTIVAEKYLTGEIKRKYLYDRLVSRSFMGRYKANWKKEMERKGWLDKYKAKRRQDSIKALKLKQETPAESLKTKP